MNNAYSKSKQLLLKIVFCIILIGVFCLGASKILLKTTYTEYLNLGGDSEEYIKIENSSDEIVQEFIAPYDILNKIGIKIGTFARINNSTWQIEILRSGDGKILCSESFSAAEITDNSYYTVKLSSNIRLEKGESYSIRVYSKNVTSNTGLAFYTTSESTENAIALSSNGESVDSKVMCLRLYGCDTDYFWLCFYCFCWCVVGAIILLSLSLHRKEINPFQNELMQGLLLFVVVFCLFYVFSKNGVTFTDENDNIRGGMIIANGGVLYRDYITQHTPVAYYLCAIFALLGAGSVEQFRLCYYVVVAAFFAILYVRHTSFWSGRRLFLIPICIIIAITTFNSQGYMILSDNIQGLCMLALCMEFLRYYADRQISISRCIIVSICIWGSFGSAFISAYALSIIVVAVIVTEICDWKKGAYSIQVKTFADRYGKLFAFIIVPFICAVAYFKFNGALRKAYDLVYRFNREIYSHYTSSGTGFTDTGYGSNILQPYFLGIKYYFSLISESFNALFSSMSVSGNIQLLIAILIGIVLIRLLMQRKYFLGSVLFLFMCCNMTRGYGFHGLAFWYVSIALIILYLPVDTLKLTEAYKPVASLAVCIIAIYCSSSYINNYCTYLFQNQSTISELEQYVISITDEDESVFIDTYTTDSIYLLYKDRYPVNRLTYFLPWYLAWYEQTAIEDLNTYSPDVIIYNPDLVTWSVHTGYSAAFRKVAEEGYAQLSDSTDGGWKYYIWIRKGTE